MEKKMLILMPAGSFLPISIVNVWVSQIAEYWEKEP